MNPEHKQVRVTADMLDLLDIHIVTLPQDILLDTVAVRLERFDKKTERYHGVLL
jgi:hypothetical protein